MFVLRLFTSLRTVTHSGLTSGLATEHTLGGRACPFFRDLTATQSHRARAGPSPILQRGCLRNTWLSEATGPRERQRTVKTHCPSCPSCTHQPLPCPAMIPPLVKATPTACALSPTLLSTLFLRSSSQESLSLQSGQCSPLDHSYQPMNYPPAGPSQPTVMYKVTQNQPDSDLTFGVPELFGNLINPLSGEFTALSKSCSNSRGFLD